MKLYQSDENLVGLELLLDPSALAKRIKPWLGLEEVTLSITNLRYKPATSCLVSYRVESKSGNTFLHAKAFGKDDWQIRKQKLDEQTWIDEEFSFAAFKFPVDLEVSAVEKFVSAPDEFLSRVMLDGFNESLDCFKIVAYKPNRRFVARLDYKSHESRVLKIYDAATFSAAKSTAAVLKKIMPVEIPRRVGRSQRHRAIAFEWIFGETLDLAHQSAGELDDLMGMILEYLNRLHCSVSTKIPLAFRRSTHDLANIARDLGVIYPSLAGNLNWMYRKVAKNLQSKFEPKLIHGDFYDRQLIRTADGIRACDFDESCIGDPTSELANLVAHLHYRAAIGEIPVAVTGQINDLALHHMRRDGDTAKVERYLWNQAASIFRLMTHPFRSGSETWVEQTEQLFEQLVNQTNSTNQASGLLNLPLSRSEPPASTNQTRTAYEADLETRLTGAIRNDPKFWFLTDVFDATQTTKILQQFLPELRKLVGPYRVDRILPRRFKTGRRCMFDFELITDSGIRSIFGKASAKRLDRKALASQRTLFEQHGFGYPNSDGVCVPRPIGCIEPWNIWFQEKIEAVSCSDLLDANLPIPGSRIATAISKLHASDFTIQRQHTVADELTILTDRLESMLTNLPRESKRIEKILGQCILIGDTIRDQPFVPVHRDFYQDQILFAQNETFLVDLDLISLGHPALDVGNFLAHLMEHAVRFHDNPRHWQIVESEIADKYLALNPSCAYRDITAFKALSFARHIFIGWSIPKRRPWTTEIIDAAEALTCEFLSNSPLPK